jgi:hypothetical protein
VGVKKYNLFLKKILIAISFVLTVPSNCMIHQEEPLMVKKEPALPLEENQPWYKRWFNAIVRSVTTSLYRTSSEPVISYSEEEMKYVPVDLTIFPRNRQELEQERNDLEKRFVNDTRLYKEWYNREKAESDSDNVVEFEKRATRFKDPINARLKKLEFINILLNKRLPLGHLYNQKNVLKIKLAKLRRENEKLQESKNQEAQILKAKEIAEVIHELQCIDLEFLKYTPFII